MRATRAAIVATAHKSTESAPFQLLLDCYASTKGTDNNVVELEDRLRQRPDAALNDVIQALCDTEDPAIRLKLSVLGLSLAPVVEKTDLVVEVVHTVVTDVWSQVRKDGGRYVAKHLVPVLPLATLEAILVDILRLCKTDGTEWRSLDGGFYLLAMLLSTVKKRASSAGYTLGGHTLDHLPSILLTDLKPAVYSAMANEQLSVREHATAAMTNYVAISDPFTQIGTFQEVISKLHLHSPHDVLPAAHAEGLLDVAAQLVPHIPIAFLAKHWHVVFPTCEKYIMHLASTVRQKSSLLVRELAELSIVAPSDTSLRLLQSILTSLATPCSVHPDATQRDFFWQRLEGRLMSVDTVLSLLGHHQLATSVAAIDKVETKIFLATPPLSEPALAVWRRVGADATYYTFAHDMAPLATWPTEAPAAGISVVQQLVDAKLVCFSELWHAYMDMTFECFCSSQFELKRIAAQTLPGLVRLSLWLESPELLLTWKARQTLTTVDVRFVCLGIRALLLHTRFLQEVQRAAPTPTLAVLTAMAQSTTDAMLPLLLANDLPQLQEKTEVLGLIEASLVYLVQAPSFADPLCASMLAFMASHCALAPAADAKDSSLDRSMSSTVVRFLPSLVQAMPPTVLATQLCHLVLVVSSWIKPSDDSLRWIIVDMGEAYALLLDTLLLLAVRSSDWDEASLEHAVHGALCLLAHPSCQPLQRAKILHLMELLAPRLAPSRHAPMLNALLAPLGNAGAGAAAKDTAWDSWDDDAPKAATSGQDASANERAFWKRFQASSLGGTNVAAVVAQACSAQAQAALTTWLA